MLGCILLPEKEQDVNLGKRSGSRDILARPSDWPGPLRDRYTDTVVPVYVDLQAGMHDLGSARVLRVREGGSVCLLFPSFVLYTLVLRGFVALFGFLTVVLGLKRRVHGLIEAVFVLEKKHHVLQSLTLLARSAGGGLARRGCS